MKHTAGPAAPRRRKWSLLRRILHPVGKPVQSFRFQRPPDRAAFRAALGIAATLLMVGTLGGCGLGSGGRLPMCGSDTYPPNYVDQVHLERWKSLPVTVYFTDPDLAYSGASGGQRFSDTARAGFDGWVTGTGDIVSYRVVTSPSGADVVVSFPELPAPPTQAGTELGKSVVSYQGNALQHVDLQVFRWPGMTPEEATAGVQAVAAHEFGHALGIDGHSRDPADVMFGAAVTSAPTQSDVNTLKTAYCTAFAARAQAVPACAEGSR